MTCAKLVLSLAIVVALACDVASAYRVHVSKGGDYSLPTIPGYPTPTKTFPGRDRGLPPYYQGKFKRSAEEDIAVPEDGGILAFEEVPEELEVSRFPRSANEDDTDGELVPLMDYPSEFTREKRSYKIIRPTYKPQINRPKRPKFYYV